MNAAKRHGGERYVFVPIVFAAAAALAGILIGAFGASLPHLQPRAYRIWWLVSAAICAGAGIGLVMRRAWGWYLALTGFLAIAAAALWDLSIRGGLIGMAFLAFCALAIFSLVKSASYYHVRRPAEAASLEPTHEVS